MATDMDIKLEYTGGPGCQELLDQSWKIFSENELI
jgi:hypothetical protein